MDKKKKLTKKQFENIQINKTNMALQILNIESLLLNAKYHVLRENWKCYLLRIAEVKVRLEELDDFNKKVT